MNIVIVRSFPLNDTEFYNIQEIGLASSMSRYANVLLLVPETENNNLTSQEVEIRHLPYYSFKNQRALKKIGRYLKEFNADVVIVGGDYQLSAISTAIIAKAMGVQVWLYQGVYADNGLKRRLMTWIMDLFLKRTLSGIFVKSYMAEKFMRSRGYNNVHAVGVGLDTSKFPGIVVNKQTRELAKRKLNLSDNKVVLLHVGELSDRRNAHDTIRIMMDALDKIEGSVGFVIGEGPYKSAFEKSHRRLHFLGMISQDKLPQYYLSADALVNAFQSEIFGMTILEALYFGCVCFCDDRAAGPKYLRNLFANRIVTLNSNHVETWTSTIMQHLDQFNFDETENKSVAEQITWNHVAEQYMNSIKESVLK